MVYLLQLHIKPFSEWHLAGASVSYGHFSSFNHVLEHVSLKKDSRGWKTSVDFL